MRVKVCFVAAGLLFVTQAWIQSDRAAAAPASAAVQSEKSTAAKAADKTKAAAESTAKGTKKAATATADATKTAAKATESGAKKAGSWQARTIGNWCTRPRR